MRRLGFIMIALLIWLTPAFVAGLLGWPGIWGTGSAFGDLLLPIPISGGILRLPTFILALLIIQRIPEASDRTLGLLRAAALGAALLGLVMLLDFERVYLFLTTDVGGRMIDWEQNYIALSLAVDGAWVFALSLRRLLSWRWAVAAMAAALLMPGAYVAIVLTLPVDDGHSSTSLIFPQSVREDFRIGSGALVVDQFLGEEAKLIWTRRSVDEPGFRVAAREFAERLSFAPQHSHKAEVVALYFTDSMEVSRGGSMFLYFKDGEPVVSERAEQSVHATLCMYEDGTPDRWGTGIIDCFSDYSTFEERFQQFASEYRSVYPSDIAWYLTMRRLCDGVELPNEASDDYAAVDFCGDFNLQASRARLLENYSEEELREMLNESEE